MPRSEWPGITHIFVTHGDPDHYWNLDCPALFSRKYNPADENRFRSEVERMGMRCHLLRFGDDIDL